MFAQLNRIKTACAALLLAAAAAAPNAHAWEPLPRLANDVVSNTQDAIEVAYRVGDTGRALNDLVYFNRMAQNFAYTLSPFDFQNLRNAYQVSRSSWTWLRAYSYANEKFRWIDGDMQEITRQMGGVPPIQPPQQIITVTGQGSGGTHQGNKKEACDRAQDRAIQDAHNACASQRGNVISSWASACSCHGPSNDYNCRASASAQCRLW